MFKDFCKDNKHFVEAMAVLTSVVFLILIVFGGTAALVKYSRHNSYDDTEMISTLDCDQKLTWLKNAGEVTLTMFSDKDGTRWYITTEINRNKMEVQNVKSVCAAIEANTQQVAGFLKALETTEEYGTTE